MDQRRHKRYRVNRTWIRASWIDHEGTLHTASVKVLNISQSGIAIELPERLREFATIKLKSAIHGLDGSAVVRRCKFSGLHYVIGLEFEDIVWTPPPEPPSDFVPLSGKVPVSHDPSARCQNL